MSRRPTSGRPAVLTATALAAVFAIASCGSDEAAGGSGEVTSTVQIAATEYAFKADARIVIEAGDTVEFVMRNEGAIDHQLEVLSEASRRLGVTDRVAPGQSDSLIVTFDEPGVYQVICDIDNHRSLGQVAAFEVISGASEEG